MIVDQLVKESVAVSGKQSIARRTEDAESESSQGQGKELEIEEAFQSDSSQCAASLAR